MDFSFSEQEDMVIDMSTAYAECWLADYRDYECQGSLPEATRAAFADSGLALLAAQSEEFEEISWPARCAVLSKLAIGDAAATLALWMGAAVPKWARCLGVPEPVAAGLTCIQVVDDAQGTTHLSYALLDGADRVLLLDSSGHWVVAQVETNGTHALALHGAGPVACRITEGVAQGTAPDAGTAVIGELRLTAASILVGLAEGAQNYAAEYMQTRQTFGKTLNQHQGLAFIFADMAIATDGAKLLLQKAAWDRHQPSVLADAYLEAVDAALFTTSHGVQLLGGHGFMTDHPVEKWMREARAISLLWGGVDCARRDAVEGAE